MPRTPIEPKKSIDREAAKRLRQEKIVKKRLESLLNNLKSKTHTEKLILLIRARYTPEYLLKKGITIPDLLTKVGLTFGDLAYMGFRQKHFYDFDYNKLCDILGFTAREFKLFRFNLNNIIYILPNRFTRRELEEAGYSKLEFQQAAREFFLETVPLDKIAQINIFRDTELKAAGYRI